MAAIEGVVHAREVSAAGAVTRIDLAHAAAPCEGWRLIHLGRDSLEARDWLLQRSGLSENAVYALLEEDTRPRAAAMEGGALLMLRAPELDRSGGLQRMVSVRLFITAHRIVSVQRRHLPIFDARVAALDAGEGAEGVAAFMTGLVEEIRRAVEPVLDRLETAIDKFELDALKHDSPPTQRERHRLNEARRSVVLLRRFLAPQADALRGLVALRPDWLTDGALIETLREEADHFRRAAEDLDALRARAVIVSDEAALRVAEQTNQRLLTLSVVSLMFLPLTFLTGLLGVNLAGIPFAEHPWAFTGFALSTVGAGVVGVWMLRRRKLL
jgi:zinc transporter